MPQKRPNGSHTPKPKLTVAGTAGDGHELRYPYATWRQRYVTLIEDLLSQHKLRARCPHCDETFSLRQAKLFDTTKALPADVRAFLARARAQLEENRAKLGRLKKQAREAPRRTAEAVRIGKVVEKIGPSLPGFPLHPRDCRALFEPIDYVAFKGLSERGAIDAVVFIDVKSGGAVLQSNQRQIKRAVERGDVQFTTMAARE